MDYVFYRQIFRGIIKTNLVDHHTIPLVSQQDLPPPIETLHHGNFDISFGLYGVLSIGEEPEDLADMLVKRKKTWLRQKIQLEDFDKKNALRSLAMLRKNKELKIYAGLRKYLDHIKKDPLPGFEGNRNWLYSGGTLALVDDGSERAVLCAGGRGLSSITRLPLGPDDNIGTCSIQLKMNQPIHQLSVDPTTSLICARQKNNVNILKRDGSNFKLVIKKKVAKQQYFTSASIKNDLVALSQNLGSIALFNIQVNKVSYVRNIQRDSFMRCPVGDSWSQVHWRDDGLMIVRNKKLILTDAEGSGINWDLTDSFESCEDICNFFESECNSYTPYIATTHNLMQVDIRQKRILHKWAHLMKSGPSFGQATKSDDNEEVIIVQSSDPCEGVAVGCGANLSHIPPQLVPGVNVSLRQAQLNGICLDPDVSKRARYNITANVLFPGEDALKQVTQNSGGDVFIRDIQPTEPSTPEVEQSRLESWIEFENLAPINNKPQCSEIVDMTNAFDAMQLPSEGERPVAKAYWKYGRNFQTEGLRSFKDNLVEHLLDIWDVPPSMEEDVQGIDTLATDMKVEEWLKMYVAED